ncbi:MAG: hypothetical protein IKE06_00515 [Solobacterium sp.]|nr:hypothetical protein [Solobacterium sp.]MBR3128351.1 hypothetical protein [Solobacterium sp.]
MNWGTIPFRLEGEPPFAVDDYIFVPDIRNRLAGDLKQIPAYVISGTDVRPFSLFIDDMTEDEREIIRSGSLINYNRKRRGL